MINYKNIKVNINNEYNTFNFNNQEIKVLKYLPASDKFDLIMTTIQKSYVNGVCNPIRLEVFYTLNIIYLYTDIQFDIEDRMDEGALYDCLVQSGLKQLVFDALNMEEKARLDDLFAQCIEVERAYRTTAAAIVSKLVDDLPKSAEATKEIVDTFDEEKFSKVLNFAKSLNSGKI